MTSVKELSQKLHISKMRLYQIINELPEAEKPVKKGNRYVFTDDNIQAIKNRFEKNTYNLNKFSKEKSTDNLILELKKQIENYNQQINIKDSQIEKLTQLVDQSQQLVLNAQKQIESKTSSDSYPSPDSKANKAVQHWWQRL